SSPHDVVLRVALVAEAEVRVARRDLGGRPEVLVVGDTEREVTRFQAFVDFIAEPRAVAKFESGAHLGRQAFEECIEDLQVLLEARWKLEEQRTELRPELRRGLREVTKRIGAVLEPRIVRDALRRLQRQLVARWRLLIPTLKRLLVGHPIVRVIDLDRREALRVIAQHVRRRDLLRVETPFPLGIIVTGRADPDSHGSLNRGQEVGGSPEWNLTAPPTFSDYPLSPIPYPLQVSSYTVRGGESRAAICPSTRTSARGCSGSPRAWDLLRSRTDKPRAPLRVDRGRQARHRD